MSGIVRTYFKGRLMVLRFLSALLQISNKKRYLNVGGIYYALESKTRAWTLIPSRLLINSHISEIHEKLFWVLMTCTEHYYNVENG